MRDDDDDDPRPRKNSVPRQDDAELDEPVQPWNQKSLLKAGAWAAHGVAAIALLLLALETRGMAIFCIAAAAFIGCAGVPALPRRPITLYATFGVLMGYAFWVAVSAINQRTPLVLVPALLLVAGVVWLLKQPRWPAALFSAAAVILLFVLAVLQYRGRHQILDFDTEHIRRSAITSLVVLGVGFMYLGVGFAQALISQPRKKRRGRRSPSRAELEK